jgi:hypothetical protein
MRSLVAKAEALQRVPATLPIAAALPMTAFARRIALNLMRCCHCEAVKSYASYASYALVCHCRASDAALCRENAERRERNGQSESRDRCLTWPRG